MMATLDYELDPKQYQLLKAIGQAYDGTATVYLAKYLPSQSFLAVSRTNLDAVHEGFAVLQHEFYLMRLMQHENILAFNQAFITDNELWVVMPLMDLGSAREILDNMFPDGMPEMAIAYIIRDILMALDYIHRMGYVHRSVNASHILLSKTGKVTLAGLRTAVSMVEDGKWLRAVHKFPTQAVKSLPWLAPEVLEQNLLGYDTKSDIYSVGITACELANGCVPFCDMVPMKMLLEKINGTTPKLLDSSTLLSEVGQEGSAVDSGEASGNRKQSDPLQNPFTRLFSPQFHQFIEDCLKQEPADRPSASALLNHPFLKQVKKRTSEALVPFIQSLTSLTEMQQEAEQGAQETQDGDLVEKFQCMDMGESWVFD
ncbi:STE20-related kinase adapter protein alpha-like [Patiria miniata]|uniref:Protein kinase domain-containing protein n=1 Tax=Patiria miniata TaxID=46514 RepID=A0A913Z3D1_PATMI|nr:STE20-related kinase adapter protein alpha-like [Patiria miniata]XP_038045516.1 STE20-related kinase adapter protein alpha-like [Patiria miniata]